MSSSRLDESQIPVDDQVDESMVRVWFSGGLELATVLSRLQATEPERRTKLQLSARSYGMHRADVDKDISVRGLFETARKMPEPVMEHVPALISELVKTTARLKDLFVGRPFTSDGSLVGSIHVRSFITINRWFTPGLLDVA